MVKRYLVKIIGIPKDPCKYAIDKVIEYWGKECSFKDLNNENMIINHGFKSTALARKVKRQFEVATNFESPDFTYKVEIKEIIL